MLIGDSAMSKTYATGELVRLKSEVGSGSATVMVVRYHNPISVGEPIVQCNWLNKNGDLQTGHFLPDMLDEG